MWGHSGEQRALGWHRTGSGHGEWGGQRYFGAGGQPSLEAGVLWGQVMGQGAAGGPAWAGGGLLAPQTPQPKALPDAALGVPEDGGGKALRHPHQAGAVHLHDEIIHLDPGDKGTVAAGPPLTHLPRISRTGEHLAHLPAPTPAPPSPPKPAGVRQGGPKGGVSGPAALTCRPGGPLHPPSLS